MVCYSFPLVCPPSVEFLYILLLWYRAFFKPIYSTLIFMYMCIYIFIHMHARLLSYFDFRLLGSSWYSQLRSLASEMHHRVTVIPVRATLEVKS